MRLETNVGIAGSVLAAALLATGCTVAGEDAAGLAKEQKAPPGLSLKVLARGELDGRSAADLEWRGKHSAIESEKGATLDFVTAEITIRPGGETGWHSHPGIVQAIFVEGTATVYFAEAPCDGEEFSAGQVLVEHPGHVEIARNRGNKNVRVIATFIVPHGSPFRVGAAAPQGAASCR